MEKKEIIVKKKEKKKFKKITEEKILSICASKIGAINFHEKILKITYLFKLPGDFFTTDNSKNYDLKSETYYKNNKQFNIGEYDYKNKVAIIEFSDKKFFTQDFNLLIDRLNSMNNKYAHEFALAIKELDICIKNNLSEIPPSNESEESKDLRYNYYLYLISDFCKKLANKPYIVLFMKADEIRLKYSIFKYMLSENFMKLCTNSIHEFFENMIGNRSFLKFFTSMHQDGDEDIFLQNQKSCFEAVVRAINDDDTLILKDNLLCKNGEKLIGERHTKRFKFNSKNTNEIAIILFYEIEEIFLEKYFEITSNKFISNNNIKIIDFDKNKNKFHPENLKFLQNYYKNAISDGKKMLI